MTLPEKFRVLVITLSDRASRGEYEDLSGPAVVRHVRNVMASAGWDSEIITEIIPDDAGILHKLIAGAAAWNLIITTGGTGIGPRDITVDVIRPQLTKELPGIMEMIRVKYGMEKPGALISRAVAGVIGTTLVYTLPGSERAVNEYMSEIVKTMEHSFYMLYGIDKHR
ncbi:MAG TPA: molybdenum cofactor synthesis domain-containing protein [Bacteroidales bacterium]|nr:molybdenum cofactor synthesis domain-containing protein [Bacteroidales bacterium]